MSTDREKILQAAQKWVDKKKYDRAIEEYQKLVKLDPKDTRTLLKVGDLQARMQDIEGAIGTYDRVGQHYAAQGFALKAIAVYKQIRELIKKQAPELADKYAHVVPKLAEIYTQLGLTSDALATYDEVATGYLKAGRDRDAVEVFKKLVELDATNPLPHLRLAEACCRIQDLDAAIDSFWTAAQLLLNLSRRDDALKVIERILHFRQDPAYARVAAQLYLERGAREDGMQALTKLQLSFQANPKDLDTLALLAQAFTLIEQEEKSLEVYKEMARIAKDQGRADLFAQLVDHLVAVAPDDEQVRQIQSLPPPVAPPEAGVQQSSVSVMEADLLDDEASDIDALTDPIQPHIPAAPSPYRPGQASAPDVVVVSDEMAVAEEYGAPPSSFDARAHARKSIVDADAFRKLRLYSKAVETLEIALEIDPRSIPIRSKLREVLTEAGELDAALGEAVQMAAILIEDGDLGTAEALLYEVLESEPEHPTALELLQHLGGDEFTATEETSTIEDAPLPSFDLEEIGADHAMGSRRPMSPTLDDPFGGGPAEDEEAPLPSFPLGAEADAADDLMAGLPDDDGILEARDELDSLPPVDDLDARDAPLPSFADIDDDAIVPATSDAEEVLDEAEFFAARGLYDDARSILTDALARLPNHPLIIERLQELDEAAAAQSGTIERASLGPPSEAPVASDRAFDIAASLDALDDLGATSGAAPASNFASHGQEVDVDQVFAKFKEGVRAQVSESDASTHYDLGVAYKEMGLLNDAIGEFELAARDAARECMCWAMIGMIQLELGQLEPSIDAYVRGLNAQQKTVEQELSLYYDLGTVHEMKGTTEEALYYFKKIARKDPGYRDVKDRIAALEPASRVPAPTQQKAVGGDDEFDKVFDDLFDK